MTWQSHIVALCLWCVQPAVQSVVAVVMWRRKLHKQFPAFFLFLVVQDVNFAILFPLWFAGNVPFYFWLFWLGEAVNAVLGFKVIHEVFIDVVVCDSSQGVPVGNPGVPVVDVPLTGSNVHVHSPARLARALSSLLA